jgi:mRNA interferase MazF
MEGPREIRRGDIFWVVDPSGGSVPPIAHPHVVVQEDVLNASRVTTVVVCALTTNLRRAEEPGNVRLEPGEGGLPKPSVVVVSQITSVPKASLGERIGALTQARVDAVLDGLALQQRSFGRTPPRSP